MTEHTAEEKEADQVGVVQRTSWGEWQAFCTTPRCNWYHGRSKSQEDAEKLLRRHDKAAHPPLIPVTHGTTTAAAELEALRQAVTQKARELQSLVSRYTRAPGENGDRVADLLTEDAYRIGGELLAILAAKGPV